MKAAEAAVPVDPEQQTPTSAEERERAVVIVDLAGEDKKTVDFTTSFTVTWKDEETGRVRTGTFTARRPTLGMLANIAVLKAKMNAGQTLDADSDFYHEMMSSLQIILTDYPEWWQPDTFFTARPLREVWDHVRSWIDTFRKRGVGR